MQKEKWGTYHKVTNEQWIGVGNYAVEHSKTAAVCLFSKDYTKPLSESTVDGSKEENLAALK